MSAAAYAFNLDDLLTGAKESYDIFNNITKKLNEVSTQKNLLYDLYEDDQAYYVYVDVPGCKKEDVKLDLVDDMKLNITVTRPKVLFNSITKERPTGQQKRQIDLPGIIMNISAKCDNGLLVVTLNKQAENTNSRSILVL